MKVASSLLDHVRSGKSAVQDLYTQDDVDRGFVTVLPDVDAPAYVALSADGTPHNPLQIIL